MIANETIVPFSRELPSKFADRLGTLYASSISKIHKKENGQFFTSFEIASFMSSFSQFEGDTVTILDPGCGSGTLACALIEHLISTNHNLHSIKLIAYETDSGLIPYAKRTLKYLETWLNSNNVDVQLTLKQDDFVLDNAGCLENIGNLFTSSIPKFDIIISNPPYFKLSITDKRTLAAKAVVNGHPNIYALFMAISAQLLKEGGEFIFITPRSYASGGYFKKLREFFFNKIDLENAHLFVSRTDTFKRDKVLQETVIVKGVKSMDANKNPNKNVVISSCSGSNDLNNRRVRSFPKTDIIDPSTKEKVLYLPTNDFEESALYLFKSWQEKLANHNIEISTGPVVAFRASRFIKESANDTSVETAPLFWLHNVKQMCLEWPVSKAKKGQYIKVEDKSRTILLPNKNYILLRRFSSKDDKNRLIAAPYFCNSVKSNFIGVENKVNYIYRPNGHLTRNEIVGLCALLNSWLFDAYFRTFNGNINVSATELRDVPLPSLETIQEIGNSIIHSNNFSIQQANHMVNKFFEQSYMYEKS